MASQDIIDFMLGKKKGAGLDAGGGGGNDDGDSLSSPEKATRMDTPRAGARQTRASATTKKAQQSVATAFAKTMVQDWLATDDTLYQIVQSIAGLRERLWQTSFALSALREKKEEPAASWKKFGYRGASTGGGNCGSDNDDDDGLLLTADDLQLALDHDLRQHERMLAALRRCLSALHQAQEALGRRLDEYYRLLVVVDSAAAAQQAKQDRCIIILSLDDCQSLFVAAASELYRKQMMADEVFNSVHGRLLFRDNNVKGSSNEVESNDPRYVARRCSERWSRQHKESALLEHSGILGKLQQYISI